MRVLGGFKERRMMDKQMKARERMKYKEVSAGSLINVWTLLPLFFSILTLLTVHDFLSSLLL